ncbi:MAG: hypothetical protein LBV79_02120, partial [Candidatus Adiutrix sp.]|nr:hypothetical protein [Candidatus Adiutrix sp.]
MKRKIYVILIMMAALAAATALPLLERASAPPDSDPAEVARLAGELSAVMVAEEAEAERLRLAAEFVEQSTASSRAAEELLAGARAFLADNPTEAARRFEAALVLAPEQPQLLSFKAAAELKLGRAAEAAEAYRRALELKSRAGASAGARAADRLGLALSLFMLGRPAEAAPLAEEAWQARRGAVGPAAPETLSAAPRLAAMDVALNEPARAEALLQEVSALAGADGAARAEAELLLSVLYQQSGRQAADPGASGAPAGAAVQEAAPAKATPEKVAEWNRLAEGLAGHNDALAAELRAQAIMGEAELAGLDLEPGPLGPHPLWMALARVWVEAGRFPEAEELLRGLSVYIQPSDIGDFVECISLLADSLEGTGRPAEAEAYRRTAVEAAEAVVTAADSAAVERSLRMSLKLAENFVKQGKVAPEVEIELRSALARMTEAGIK